MEPISLIIGALAAGSAAAAKDVGKAAVKDGYEGLKKLIKNRFTEKKSQKGEMILAEHEKDPQTWEGPLKKELKETMIDQDQPILDAAGKLMAQLHPEQTAMGKFIVQSKNIQGMVQADNIDSLTLHIEPPTKET